MVYNKFDYFQSNISINSLFFYSKKKKFTFSLLHYEPNNTSLLLSPHTAFCFLSLLFSEQSNRISTWFTHLKQWKKSKRRPTLISLLPSEFKQKPKTNSHGFFKYIYYSDAKKRKNAGLR